MRVKNMHQEIYWGSMYSVLKYKFVLQVAKTIFDLFRTKIFSFRGINAFFIPFFTLVMSFKPLSKSLPMYYLRFVTR